MSRLAESFLELFGPTRTVAALESSSLSASHSDVVASGTVACANQTVSAYQLVLDRARGQWRVIVDMPSARVKDTTDLFEVTHANANAVEAGDAAGLRAALAAVLLEALVGAHLVQVGALTDNEATVTFAQCVHAWLHAGVRQRIRDELVKYVETRVMSESSSDSSSSSLSSSGSAPVTGTRIQYEVETAVPTRSLVAYASIARRELVDASLHTVRAAWSQLHELVLSTHDAPIPHDDVCLQTLDLLTLIGGARTRAATEPLHVMLVRALVEGPTVQYYNDAALQAEEVDSLGDNGHISVSQIAPPALPPVPRRTSPWRVWMDTISHWSAGGISMDPVAYFVLVQRWHQRNALNAGSAYMPPILLAQQTATSAADATLHTHVAEMRVLVGLHRILFERNTAQVHAQLLRLTVGTESTPQALLGDQTVERPRRATRTALNETYTSFEALERIFEDSNYAFHPLEWVRPEVMTAATQVVRLFFADATMPHPMLFPIGADYYHRTAQILLGTPNGSSLLEAHNTLTFFSHHAHWIRASLYAETYRTWLEKSMRAWLDRAAAPSSSSSSESADDDDDDAMDIDIDDDIVSDDEDTSLTPMWKRYPEATSDYVNFLQRVGTGFQNFLCYVATLTDISGRRALPRTFPTLWRDAELPDVWTALTREGVAATLATRRYARPNSALLLYDWTNASRHPELYNIDVSGVRARPQRLRAPNNRPQDMFSVAVVGKGLTDQERRHVAAITLASHVRVEDVDEVLDLHARRIDFLAEQLAFRTAQTLFASAASESVTNPVALNVLALGDDALVARVRGAIPAADASARELLRRIRETLDPRSALFAGGGLDWNEWRWVKDHTPRGFDTLVGPDAPAFAIGDVAVEEACVDSREAAARWVALIQLDRMLMGQLEHGTTVRVAEVCADMREAWCAPQARSFAFTSRGPELTFWLRHVSQLRTRRLHTAPAFSTTPSMGSFYTVHDAEEDDEMHEIAPAYGAATSVQVLGCATRRLGAALGIAAARMRQGRTHVRIVCHPLRADTAWIAASTFGPAAAGGLDGLIVVLVPTMAQWSALGQSGMLLCHASATNGTDWLSPFHAHPDNNMPGVLLGVPGIPCDDAAAHMVPIFASKGG